MPASRRPGRLQGDQLRYYADMTVRLRVQYNNTVTVMMRQASAEADQIKRNAHATVRFGSCVIARTRTNNLPLLLLSSHNHPVREATTWLDRVREWQILTGRCAMGDVLPTCADTTRCIDTGAVQHNHGRSCSLP